TTRAPPRARRRGVTPACASRRSPTSSRPSSPRRRRRPAGASRQAWSPPERCHRLKPLAGRADSRDVTLASTFGSWMQSFALDWLPVLFFALMCVVVWLLWKTVKLMPRVKPVEITPGSSSSVTWDDVAGLDEAKEELQEIVDFLRDPKKFEQLGARVPKGILLHGPPGTGKTLAAKAIASESGARFYA